MTILRLTSAMVFVLATLLAGCGDDDAAGASVDGGSSGGWSCKSGCEIAIETACPMAPPSQAECESDCADNLAGECGTAYATLMRCAEGEAITCGADGFLVIAACSAEQDAFVSCLNP